MLRRMKRKEILGLSDSKKHAQELIQKRGKAVSLSPT